MRKEETTDRRKEAEDIHKKLIQLLPMIKASTMYETKLPRKFNQFIQYEKQIGRTDVVQFVTDFSNELFRQLGGNPDVTFDRGTVNIMEHGFIKDIQTDGFLNELVIDDELFNFLKLNIDKLLIVNQLWEDFKSMRANIDQAAIAQVAKENVLHMKDVSAQRYKTMADQLLKHRPFFESHAISTLEKAKLILPESVFAIEGKEGKKNQATEYMVWKVKELETFCQKNESLTDKEFLEQACKVLLTPSANKALSGLPIHDNAIVKLPNEQFLMKGRVGPVASASKIFDEPASLIETLNISKKAQETFRNIHLPKYRLVELQKIATMKNLPDEISTVIESNPDLLDIDTSNLAELKLTKEQMVELNTALKNIWNTALKMNDQLRAFRERLSTFKTLPHGSFHDNGFNIKLLRVTLKNIPHKNPEMTWVSKTIKLFNQYKMRLGVIYDEKMYDEPQKKLFEDQISKMTAVTKLSDNRSIESTPPKTVPQR